MHFHQVDQYQIVVGGSGGMGRHPLAPITVHYTNAFTGYGPLRAGPDGLQYLTIRSRWDPGLRPLPEARGELPPAGSYKMRQRTTEPCLPRYLEEQAALREPELRLLMREGDAAAWMLELPPGASTLDPADRAMDRALVVCAGTIAGTKANGPLSCHYVPAGESLAFTSGDEGTAILVLQFANRDLG
jgi:hypothetical protein